MIWRLGMLVKLVLSGGPVPQVFLLAGRQSLVRLSSLLAYYVHSSEGPYMLECSVFYLL